MKERPILFNAEMVRAVLDGRKTQTRRIVKDCPTLFHPTIYHPENGILKSAWIYDEYRGVAKCPYGMKGDRLWVRETFACLPEMDGLPPSMCDDRGVWWRASLDTFPEGYAACHGKWRPSIHMPRWASRINLEIADIRVERVQDIRVKDIQSEGLAFMQHGKVNGHFIPCDEIRAFQVWEKLWDSINKKRGFGWDENPWVWVVEFKKLEA